MPAVLFDSTFYIAALRSRENWTECLRRCSQGAAVWLSAVVLEELYAGTTPRNRHVVEQIARAYERTRRIVVPNLGDWTQVGIVLARLAARYDFEDIGKGRLTNDALIAISAARVGCTIITANARDFARLAEFRSFSWQVSDPRINC